MMKRRQFIQYGAAGAMALVGGCHTDPSAKKQQVDLKAANNGQAFDLQYQHWRQQWLGMLGNFPKDTVPLSPQVKSVDPIDGIPCYHVRLQSEKNDWITGYLLVPTGAEQKKNPTILCLHPTTHGPGKAQAVGLSGRIPGEPPEPPETSAAYGLELARWGYVTFSIDTFGDGERIPKGYAYYDTKPLYDRHPHWSALGKIIWDSMRAVDFLCSLDYVDDQRIACVGHSHGGQGTVFSTAFDPRIRVGVANGSILSWHASKDAWWRVRDGKPIQSYIYIPRFEPYARHPEKGEPFPFETILMMSAPRPLLLMCTEKECKRDNLPEKVAHADKVYRDLDAGERLAMFTYPGRHRYPPVAKRFSFSWLDRWLDHTPAIPTIWPGKAI